MNAGTQAARRIRRREVPDHGPWPSATHPVLARVLAARGVVRPEHAELRLRDLHAPEALSGIQPAVELLVQAIAQGWRIVVVGDFDCDGATGTAVAVRGLDLLGATEVGFRVPHRIRHGYGLSPALVAELSEPRPDLIVTVDNGIASHAGVAAARAAGIRILITDHHLPGAELPAADAIVNPNLDGDGFPSKALAGVGVMFYLLLALRAELRRRGRFPHGEPDLAALLDLVALGTVADLVPLDHNNRILVAAGLKRLRSGRGCAGLNALAEVAGRSLSQINSSDLGFFIAPRINAAGRLEDMSIGIACLLSDDSQQARGLAAQLHAINAERRDRQDDMLADAQAQLERAIGAAGERIGICLFEPHWHPGVVGLVASKVKEHWHRPAIAFAPADDEGASPWLRGSARSIPGFHIRDALAAIDAAEPGLIERFGGHAMAAGLSLAREHLPRFEAAFEQLARRWLRPEDLASEWLTDGELSGAEFSRDLAEQLEAAGPWGQAFPEPLFDGEFSVTSWRVVGEKHLKLDLRGAQGQPLPAIQFGGWQGAAPAERVRLVYQLTRDDYRDRRGVQLLVRQCEGL